MTRACFLENTKPTIAMIRVVKMIVSGNTRDSLPVRPSITGRHQSVSILSNV